MAQVTLMSDIVVKMAGNGIPRSRCRYPIWTILKNMVGCKSDYSNWFIASYCETSQVNKQ